jgi:DNA-binding GntR family transcriptional regulator
MPAEESTALHRKPIKDEVFDILHERIIAGRYSAGEWLRQEDIASQLGVSMTPVREALGLLASAGLAERVPYRGVRVLRPSPVEIADSYGMRLLLESAAVSAAAAQISVAQLAKLEAILDEGKCLIKLEELPRQRVLNREFHQGIACASGNGLLAKIYTTVLNTFPDWMLYEYMFRHPELLEDSIREEHAEHRAILEALAAHDPELALRKTVAHILNRGRELEAFLGVARELVAAREAQVAPLLAGLGTT